MDQSFVYIDADAGVRKQEVVKLLLDHPDVDINVSNNAGLTPLHLACQVRCWRCPVVRFWRCSLVRCWSV